MFSSKSVLRDLSLLKQSIVNSNALECKNLFEQYQRILRLSSFDERHQLAVSIHEDAVSRSLMPTDMPKNLSPKTVSGDALSNDYPDVRNKRDVVVQEAINTCVNGKYSALLQILAMASVIGRQIFTVYPNTKNTVVRAFCHGFLNPRMPLASASQQNVLFIMWTRTSLSKDPISFQPNHFVPLIPSAGYRAPYSLKKTNFHLYKKPAKFQKEKEKKTKTP
ncbi:hypothetical protein OS493_018789 [Desmophyllum pertusum]|uniref:Uncharacterized protein n=1 Tax=Desmophyllum pertusum TaxID=174260 RepID=A0A9W9ZCM4_9CNID|nr:hypothetical protein OS493_018789 [Desmophyllum pertusum]